MTSTSFPAHGPISCRRCFDGSADVATFGRWQAVNDPGAWGAAEPTILVLGFSKGATQADAYRNGPFEDVPFARARSRLTEALQALGLLSTDEFVDARMRADEERFAFGSLVRCSLARRNKKGKLECTGAVMPEAFVEEVSVVTRACASNFLTNLPASVRLVVMLGTTDAYIAGCKRLIRSIHPATWEEINDVTYRAGGVVFVHVSHPSGLNGHHPEWMEGDPATTSGRKRQWAEEGVRIAL